MVGGFIILLIVLKHFGLYEGFKSNKGKAPAKTEAAKAKAEEDGGDDNDDTDE